MQPIHIEPDAIRELSRQMEWTVMMVLDEKLRFKQSINRLEMNWKGPASDQFFTEAKQLDMELHERIKQLYYLCLRLEQTANSWEESDYTWQSQFQWFFS